MDAIKSIPKNYKKPIKSALVSVSKENKTQNIEKKEPIKDYVSLNKKNTEEKQIPKDWIIKNQAQKKQQNSTTIQKEWTILHYSATDNNLSYNAYQNINSLEKFGSSEDINIISLLDRGKDDCKVYYIKKDDNNKKVTSPILKDLGNTDTSDPKVLKDYLTSMMKKYPAKNYAVIFASHGQGWKGTLIDKTSDGYMKIPQLGKTLKEVSNEISKKIDIVGFDACLMGAVEVADEIKDSTNYMVASQDAEGLEGWRYEDILKDGKLNKKDPRQFASDIISQTPVEDSSISTLSALDLSKMDKYEDTVNKFSQAILDTQTPNSIFDNILKNTNEFAFPSFKDQYTFASLIAKNPEIKDQKLKKTAKELMKVLKEEVVINNKYTQYYMDSNGLNATIPKKNISKEDYNKNYETRYKDLKFAKNTLWDEAFAKIRKPS